MLDRLSLDIVAEADAAARRFGEYYNYHRLHGELGWATPAERFDGTPFADRGLEHLSPLAALPSPNRWLAALRPLSAGVLNLKGNFT